MDNKLNYYKSSVIGKRPVLWSDITRAGTSEGNAFKYLNAVRIFIHIESIVNNVANQIMFKVNDARTRTLFNTRVNSAMERLRRAGIISQYNVVCNENNNTQDIIDAYAFKASVLFVPALTIEIIELVFNTERSGTTQVTSTSSSSLLVVEDAESGTIISNTTGNISY